MNDRNEPPPNQSSIPLEYAGPMPGPARGKARRVLLFLAVTLGGIVLAAVTLLPSLDRASGSSNRLDCPRNMNQIAQACAMYAKDHGGTFPADLGTLFREQDLTPSVFICPSSNDVAPIGPTKQAVATNLLTPGHNSYVYLGKGLTETAATGDIVILYEPLSNHANNGMNVLFGDGHTEWISAPAAQPLLNQVAAGTWPVRLPPAPVAASQPSP